MAYEHKNGSGALFKNDKQGNESRPDYRGDLMIEGTLYEIAAWVKESGSGKKFMSLSANPKQAAAKPSAPPTRTAPPKAQSSRFDDIEDCPF